VRGLCGPDNKSLRTDRGYDLGHRLRAARVLVPGHHDPARDAPAGPTIKSSWLDTGSSLPRSSGWPNLSTACCNARSSRTEPNRLLRKATIAGMTSALAAGRAADGCEPGPEARRSAELIAAQRCYEWACTRYRFEDLGEGRLVPCELTGEVRPVLQMVPPDRLEPGTSLLAYAMAMPFDPSAGPLIRGFSQPDDDELVVVVHHLVADGRSAVVLGDWLRQALTGSVATTEPRTASYAAYAQWERRWRDSRRYQDALRHWDGALEDADAPCHIHASRRLASATGAGAARLLRLSGQASHRVRRASRESGSSPAAVLLTLWATAVRDTLAWWIR
jgi:hypothetical protein